MTGILKNTRDGVQNAGLVGGARSSSRQDQSGFLFVLHASRLANSACLEANKGWEWQEIVTDCRLHAPLAPNANRLVAAYGGKDKIRIELLNQYVDMDMLPESLRYTCQHLHLTK